MDRQTLENGLRENKIFQVDDSFFFSAQIPDDSVGISGSRCSNCNAETPYCYQICRSCNLPFIGPFGFRQLNEWNALPESVKKLMVIQVYRSRENRGRLGYTNVKPVPLTLDELEAVERLNSDAIESFLSAHRVDPREIRKILLKS